MKTKVLLLAAAVFATILAGCGGSDNRPALIVTDINSAGGTDDGDITTSDGINFTVFTSNQPGNSVVVNFDGVTDTRGFITFSLASVPTNASIQRATVFLPILSATPIGLNASVGLNVDMVTFPPLDTLATNPQRANVFNALPILQGPSFAVFPGDAGFDVTFDATGAVIEANTPPALSTLQFRLISSGGEVVIDDLFVPATGAGTPLLRVEYF